MNEASIKKFWSRIDKSGECWIWKGSCVTGYGVLNVGRKNEYIHRFSYRLHFGEFDPKLKVCHTCENRKCGNPAHLVLVERGSGDHNDKTMFSKFSAETIAEMQALYDSGEPVYELTARFGMSESTVYKFTRDKRKPVAESTGDLVAFQT